MGGRKNEEEKVDIKLKSEGPVLPNYLRMVLGLTKKEREEGWKRKGIFRVEKSIATEQVEKGNAIFV